MVTVSTGEVSIKNTHDNRVVLMKSRPVTVTTVPPSIEPEIGKIESYGVGIDWKPNPTLFIMPQVILYNMKWYDVDISEVGGSLKIVYVPVQ